MKNSLSTGPSWNAFCTRTKMSPLVFRIRPEFQERVLGELNKRDIPSATDQGFGMDYEDEYDSWALLDGLVLAAYCNNPFGNTVQDGLRIVGADVLRLICHWIDISPPRRLKSEVRQPSPGGDELESELEIQLISQRTQLDQRAARFVRADDVLVFARAIDELFGREWALRTTSERWSAQGSLGEKLEGWLLASGDWGEAQFSEVEAKRLKKLNLIAVEAVEWYDLAERNRPMWGEVKDEEPATAGSVWWLVGRTGTWYTVKGCIESGVTLIEAKREIDLGATLNSVLRAEVELKKSEGSMTDSGHLRDPTLIIGTGVDRLRDDTSTLLGDLRQHLVQQLAELPGHEVRWALVIDFADRSGYVQFLGRPDGSLQCECQSNLNRRADCQLEEDDENQLLGLGWQRPEPPQYSNWYHVVSSGDGSALEIVATRAIATLAKVFRATETDKLKVKLMSLSDSGDVMRISTLPARGEERSPSEAAPRPPKSAPKSRAITIARSEEGLRVITSSGQLLAQASDAAALVVSTRQMDESPLVLAQGFALTLLLPRAERAIIIEALEPDDALTNDLYEKHEKLEEDEAFIEFAPINTRNRIDDQRWGWLPLMEAWSSDESQRPFGMFPIGNAPELARFNAWMSASMTGAVISSGLRHRGPHAVVWVDNDSDPDTATIYYEIEDFDDLLVEVFYWEDPICPECDEDDPSGWELDFSVSPSFSDLAIGRAMTQVWAPCSEHKTSKVRFEAAGRTWRWVRRRWEPVQYRHG